MKIITISGSMRFYEKMMQVAEDMELQGNCVLVPLFNPNRPNKDAYTDTEASILDQMHKERIKLADTILVVDVDGYIGASTKKEIEFAKSLNKEIIYYTDIKR